MFPKIHTLCILIIITIIVLYYQMQLSKVQEDFKNLGNVYKILLSYFRLY